MLKIQNELVVLTLKAGNKGVTSKKGGKGVLEMVKSRISGPKQPPGQEISFRSIAEYMPNLAFD